MEGNCRRESPHPPWLPSAANIGCNQELTRSNSDASSLTAENCKDTFRRSANVTPDDRTRWTDEKHNLYLHHLEVSFVKQLHQSKCLLAQCSEQNQGGINMSQKRLINVENASEQFNVLRNGCWQKINCVGGEPLSSSTSADSCASLKSKSRYKFKRMGMHCHPPSAEMPGFLKLCSTVESGKGTITHGLATCSLECSSNNPFPGDLFDLKREGTGQNFLDEDNQSTSNFESQAKRLKTALADSSRQDQVISRLDFLLAILFIVQETIRSLLDPGICSLKLSLPGNVL
ncbi:hypothetical protein Pfo_002645 [Paulownia fortunei]|nr:hypothetical protein Pfo_002645 [Paulownia fortunei]